MFKGSNKDTVVDIEHFSNCVSIFDFEQANA